MTDCKGVKVHLRWKKPERRSLENHDTTNVQSRESSADVVPSPMRQELEELKASTASQLAESAP